MSNHGKILVSLLRNIDHKVGCEVGVHAGETAKCVLESLDKIEKYHVIDPWKIYEMYDGNLYRKPSHKKFKSMDEAYFNFVKTTKPYKSKIICHKMTSVEAAELIENESLDWVFIDANHEYEYVKENLKLWIPKVKSGGLISGHDYGNKWKGVKKAVNEVVPKEILNISPFYVWSFIKR
jgi:hypothetical protein